MVAEQQEQLAAKAALVVMIGAVAHRNAGALMAAAQRAVTIAGAVRAAQRARVALFVLSGLHKNVNSQQLAWEPHD